MSDEKLGIVAYAVVQLIFLGLKTFVDIPWKWVWVPTYPWLFVVAVGVCILFAIFIAFWFFLIYLYLKHLLKRKKT